MPLCQGKQGVSTKKSQKTAFLQKTLDKSGFQRFFGSRSVNEKDMSESALSTLIV